MTEAASSGPRHTVATNLFWFAAIFVLACMAITSLAPLFSMGGGAFIGQILSASVACAIAAFVAGTRFVDNRTDLASRRVVLLLSYLALAAALYFSVPALMLAGLLLSGATISPEASHSIFGGALLVLGTIAATLPLNGIIVWFILSSLARSREIS